MRRQVFSIGLVMAILAATLGAVGSTTVTKVATTAQVQVITVAWASSAGGAVSGNTFATAGKILQVQFTPGSGATQPTDLYDVTLVNGAGVDLLTQSGTSYGANLSNATSAMYVFSAPPFQSAGDTLDVVIANAGNAKTGTVTIWVQGSL